MLNTKLCSKRLTLQGGVIFVILTEVLPGGVLLLALVFKRDDEGFGNKLARDELACFEPSRLILWTSLATSPGFGVS